MQVSDAGVYGSMGGFHVAGSWNYRGDQIQKGAQFALGRQGMFAGGTGEVVFLKEVLAHIEEPAVPVQFKAFGSGILIGRGAPIGLVMIQLPFPGGTLPSIELGKETDSVNGIIHAQPDPRRFRQGGVEVGKIDQIFAHGSTRSMPFPIGD